MKINNLETGLRKTLVAAFRSKGLSNAAADAKAAKHLAAATTHFHVKLAGREKTGKTIKAVTRSSAASGALAKLALARDLFGRRQASLSDSPRAVSAALRSVAVWARTL